MNYIWDVLLKADKQKLSRHKVTFVPAKSYSPYMEISFVDLNTNTLPEDNLIEVNPYYRFHDLFKDFLQVNVENGEELIEATKFREVLFDIVMHYLAEIDLQQGFRKEEFYKRFIKEEMYRGIFGKEISKAVQEFNKEELDALLSGLITLYATGISLQLFNKVMRKIFKNNRIYVNKDDKKEILIYIGETKNEKLIRKIETIIDMFLPINMKFYVYWERHFGIIGINETMKIDEMAIN